MHWLTPIVYAFLYALVGSVIGITYALLTGADALSFESVVGYGAVFGPVVILMIVAFRRLAKDAGFKIPVARAIYHTLLVTVAAPVIMYAAQLIAGALDASKVARSFEVVKYWSIPSVFILACMYGIWRVVKGNRPRATGATGGPGSAPTSGSGDANARPTAAQRAASGSSPSEPPGTKRVAWVLSFSSRGGPSRWIPRLVEDL